MGCFPPSWPQRAADDGRDHCREPQLVVPEADSIAPVPAALEVARKAPGAELFRSAGGHYDVYEGGASFADVLRTEVDFLHRHVKTAAQKLS